MKPDVKEFVFVESRHKREFLSTHEIKNDGTI